MEALKVMRTGPTRSPAFIEKAIAVIDAVAVHRPQMTANTLIAFLIVCQEDGQKLSDIKARLSTTPSGATRVLATLHDDMGLITFKQPSTNSRASKREDDAEDDDPDVVRIDRRVKYAFLTPKGQRVWSQIRHIIEGGDE